MNQTEAIKKAEDRLNLCIHISECSENKGRDKRRSTMSEIERAIEIVVDWYERIDCEYGPDKEIDENRDHLISILRAELSRQENAPLTWEELITMDGKPVFIVSGRKDNELNGWFLVSAERHNVESVEFTGTIDNLVLSSITDELSPEECFYGMTCNIECGEADCARNGLHHMGWLAYRYEPKGEKEFKQCL